MSVETALHTAVDYIVACGTVLVEEVDHLDQVLSDWPPVLVVLITALVVSILTEIHRWVWDSHLSLFERGKRKFFKMLRRAPIIGQMIKDELKTTKSDIAKTSFKLPDGQNYQIELPKQGIGEEELLKTLKKNYISIEEIKWKEGRVSGTVYTGGNKEIMGKVFELFVCSNLLQPGVFPGARKMEAEVVSMCCKLFKGGPDSCGTTTSGGTESILLACLAYKELALSRGVKKPEMVIPDCAHAAFEKAGHLFDIRVIRTSLDKRTWKADVKAMKSQINKNTCMLVVSAACFPHGVIDPISDVAKLGLKYNIPVHIDMCMGGFLYPFLRLAGHDIPPADLSVPGVTSLSADIHKYGLAPKGSSVVLYSHTKYRQGQFFVSTDWTGGVYASPTLAGSRSGAIVATAWATLMLTGLDGYIQHSKRVVERKQYLEDRVKKIRGLKVIGEPKLSQLTIISDVFDVYRLGAALSKRGWVPYTVQRPSGLCMVVTDLMDPKMADQMLKDVEECTAEIMKNPSAKADGMAAVYGMAATLPDRSLVSEFICGYLDAFYSTTKLAD